MLHSKRLIRRCSRMALAPSVFFAPPGPDPKPGCQAPIPRPLGLARAR